MGRRVALSGRIGSGKSALAGALTKYHGFRRVSIMGGLKTELSQILGVPQADFSKSETKGQWRRLMQEWGQARRRVHPDYWALRIRKVIKILDGEHMGELNIVIDDMRFLNEMRLLHIDGFDLVFLDCPRPQSVQYMVEEQGMTPQQAEDVANDASERDIPERACGEMPPHVDVKAPRTQTLGDIYASLCQTLGLEPRNLTYDRASKEWADVGC